MVMESKEIMEFIAMLLVEKKCQEDFDFHEYFLINSDRDSFNNRYKILLDKFLTMYAVNNTEKSD